MASSKKNSFAIDPETSIQKIIAEFVRKNPLNRWKVGRGTFFHLPFVGFSSGEDPLFKEYKKIIGRFHFTPRDIFDLTFGKTLRNKKLSVISWVLPVSKDVRRSNRGERIFPSLLWSHTRWFGEAFNDSVRDHVVSFLKRKGYKAVAPANSAYFKHHMHSLKVGFTSNWSERHMAYTCGLGTFGLCDGFITPKGKALRLGSVVTDLILRPSEKPYSHHHANCLYFFNGTCKVCVKRCPCGAITEKGHNKDRCFDYMHNIALPTKKREYGVEITGCGLCQTSVPCEFEIPRLIQKDYRGRGG